MPDAVVHAFVLLQLISDRHMSVFEFSFLGQWNIGLGLFQLLLLIGSVFLILLILVQRGKGGGLTGALGGMGGQSAFGAKAGDAFTKVTVVTSLIWITLCMVTIALFNQPPPKSTKTTKSAIDIARDIENGVKPEDIEINPQDTGNTGMRAREGEVPESPAQTGSDADADAGNDADAGDASDAGDKVDAGGEADTETSEIETETETEMEAPKTTEADAIEVDSTDAGADDAIDLDGADSSIETAADADDK